MGAPTLLDPLEGANLSRWAIRRCMKSKNMVLPCLLHLMLVKIWSGRALQRLSQISGSKEMSVGLTEFKTTST
jgi:hypothetical protein